MILSFKIGQTKRNIEYCVKSFKRMCTQNAFSYCTGFLASMLGIGSLAYIHQYFAASIDSIFIIGSFGASAVLLYGAPNSPFSRSKNVFWGHIFSATIGVFIANLIIDPELKWLACALAVSLAILVMQLTKTIHPPGGATALIAVIGSSTIKSLGFLYILNPVLTGVLGLLVFAKIMSFTRKTKV